MNAKSMAAARIKIAPTRFEPITWAEFKAEFGAQIKAGECPGQRNHGAQVMHGWNHIKQEVLAGQATFGVIRFEGPCKKSMPKRLVADGFHRADYWMSLEDDKVLDACPFTLLNLEIHTVTAKTKEEAKLKADAIARSYNSVDSVKKGGDFLSAAVRQAGLVAVSAGYSTGRGSGVVSFLARVVGNAKTPTPFLTKTAMGDLAAHQAMDQVLLMIEASPRLRALRGKAFHPGVMQALFERFQRLSASELAVAGGQFGAALNNLGKAHASTMVPMGAVATEVHKVLTQLTDLNFIDKVRSVGNREQQYNYVRDMLRDKFVILGIAPAAVSLATGTKL
jgi:hypothetical protein